VVDVGDEDGHALGRDSSREPPPDRDPHPLLNLLLDPLGGPSHELVRLSVVEQDGHRVHRQDFLDAN
jgi:hypothetical protein